MRASTALSPTKIWQTADPPVTFASGSICLKVSDDDHERAHEILNRATKGSALPDDFAPSPPIQEDNRPPSQPSGRSTLGKLISACLFTVLSAVLYHFYQRSQLPPLTETIKVEEDMDEDDKIAQEISWLKNRPVHEALDLNGDGNLDTTIDNHERGKATQKTDFDLDAEVDLIAFYGGVRYMRQD
ncbi:MAG: hypothetical protein L7V86_19525 [Verrucomicrobiales bacterium]|nr:hypothetical protein [Verrucomicrobiales bacterium]